MKNKLKQKGLVHGSSGRVSFPTKHEALSLETQYHQKKILNKILAS
jgi:hypothetical protein